MPLVALVTDPNNHGDGRLIDPPQDEWTFEGLLVCTVDTIAQDDDLDHPTGPTNAADGVSAWTIKGFKLHRHGDPRYCGAVTVVQSQSIFTVGAARGRGFSSGFSSGFR